VLHIVFTARAGPPDERTAVPLHLITIFIISIRATDLVLSSVTLHALVSLFFLLSTTLGGSAVWVEEEERARQGHAHWWRRSVGYMSIGAAFVNGFYFCGREHHDWCGLCHRSSIIKHSSDFSPVMAGQSVVVAVTPHHASHSPCLASPCRTQLIIALEKKEGNKRKRVIQRK
jgi:hypothetical protein